MADDPQVQMTVDTLMAHLRDIERWHTLVLMVHPDQVGQVRAAVDQLPPDYLPGLIRIYPSGLVKPNELVIYRPPDWLLPPPPHTIADSENPR